MKLSSITSIVVGYVGPISKDYTDEQNGVPLLSTTNISKKDFSVLKKFVSRDFHSRNKKSQAYPDDILVARHGASGTSVIVPESLQESHVLAAVIYEKSEVLDLRFLSYFLNFHAFSGGVSNSRTGTIQSIINTSVVRDILIPLPPLEIQRDIVARIERERAIVQGNRELIGLYEEKVKKGHRAGLGGVMP